MTEQPHSRYDWLPEDEDGAMLRISKSSAGDFDWCAQQYRLNHLKGLKKKTSPEMMRGTDIHDAYEEMFKTLEPDYLVEILDDGDEEGAELLFKESIMEHIKNPDEPTEACVDGLASLCIDRFISDYEDNTTDRFIPIGSEVRVHAMLTFEYGGEEYDVHLTGLIDNLFHGDEGGVIIGELKTGKFKKAAYIRKEMAWYALALQNLIPGVPLMANAGRGSTDSHPIEIPRQPDGSILIEGWGWEYPASRHRGYEKLNKRSVTAARKRIEKQLRAHILYEFPGNVHKCSWCPFTRHCPVIHPTNHLGDSL